MLAVSDVFFENNLCLQQPLSSASALFAILASDLHTLQMPGDPWLLLNIKSRKSIFSSPKRFPEGPSRSQSHLAPAHTPQCSGCCLGLGGWACPALSTPHLLRLVPLPGGPGLPEAARRWGRGGRKEETQPSVALPAHNGCHGDPRLRVVQGHPPRAQKN